MDILDIDVSAIDEQLQETPLKATVIKAYTTKTKDRHTCYFLSVQMTITDQLKKIIANAETLLKENLGLGYDVILGVPVDQDLGKLTFSYFQYPEIVNNDNTPVLKHEWDDILRGSELIMLAEIILGKDKDSPYVDLKPYSIKITNRVLRTPRKSITQI